jgi:hypothetical protein
LHVLHYLQGCDGSKFTAQQIRDAVGGASCEQKRVNDLVQALSQMLMRWVMAPVTTLSLRLNGLADMELHEGGLDTEK